MSRILFWTNLVTAVLLIALVLLCPLVDNGSETPDGAVRVVALFARDGALRRTALACAVGLTVTAFLFFRSPAGPPAPSESRPKRKSVRPPTVAGA